ncbi:hypothetical protein VHEMI07930 [[Torrubiella] hemipterigena]|uniref:2EXR domain-containing protein n=1 Tax=[Torrubiella] hemipterigena TaxID=1531966 RepID=A0A0A1TBX3_9HYPO|nr:hypothetical protein VHEMI07930 [[Torrubiella] hemipterigena]
MFILFSRLPLELRQRIWLLAVGEDQQAVCPIWPLNLVYDGTRRFETAETLPLLPLTVDTSYPTVMHVCQESRATIQNLAQNSVRFRKSEAAGCDTPFRLYDPDMDILYIGTCAMRLLDLIPFESKIPAQRILEEPQEQPFFDLLVASKHLAFETFDFFEYSWYLWRWMWEYSLPSPSEALNLGLPLPPPSKTLHLVVPSSNFVAENTDQRFKQPGRRCRLKPLSTAALDQVIIHSSTSDYGEYELRSMREALKDIRPRLFSASDELDGQWKWAQQIPVRADTFEEYRNGTWDEVCRDRVYEVGYARALADYASAPPVPLRDRPDPVLTRPHDVDTGFEPWKDPHRMI